MTERRERMRRAGIVAFMADRPHVRERPTCRVA